MAARKTKLGRRPKWGVAKIFLSIRVTPLVKKYLMQADDSASETIERHVRRSGDFKNWRKDNGC